MLPGEQNMSSNKMQLISPPLKAERQGVCPCRFIFIAVYGLYSVHDFNAMPQLFGIVKGKMQHIYEIPAVTGDKIVSYSIPTPVTTRSPCSRPGMNKRQHSSWEEALTKLSKHNPLENVMVKSQLPLSPAEVTTI